MRGATGFLCAALAFTLHAPALAAPVEPVVRQIDDFSPLGGTFAETHLRFIGGLHVSSSASGFGGFSGVDVDGDRILLVSDIGTLLRARLTYRDGRLDGLVEADLSQLFPGDGRSKEAGDVEDVAFDPGNRRTGVIVRERQANAMYRFRMVDGRPSDFTPMEVGAENRLLRSNRGLESVAYAPSASPVAGSILAIAEHPPRGMTNIPAWVAGEGQLEIVRRDGFDISSARFLPDGDLLLLERRLSPAWGLGVRIRRIPGSAVGVGALLDGPHILDAGMTAQIDNMEGLAVHRDAAGRIILTLVSDDNQNLLQRTLVLQFELLAD